MQLPWQFLHLESVCSVQTPRAWPYLLHRIANVSDAAWRRRPRHFRHRSTTRTAARDMTDVQHVQGLDLAMRGGLSGQSSETRGQRGGSLPYGRCDELGATYRSFLGLFPD